MRRQWNTIRDQEAEGSSRSAELATALAQICDPETLERLLHLKILLDSIGGQGFICAYRSKYDAETGERLGKVELDRPGVYETDGYLFHFDHIATALRERQPSREPDAKLEEPIDLVEVDEYEGEEVALAADIEAKATAGVAE